MSNENANEIEKIKALFSGIDPMDFTKEWGGDELSSIFYADYILRIGKKNIHIPAEIRNAANGGLDFFKTIVTSIDEYKNIKQLLKYSIRRKKEKGARLVCDAVLKNLNHTSKIVSLLSFAGVLTGAAGLITISSVAFPIAAASWGVAALSCARLHRSIKKYNDPSYWLEDILDQYKNIQNKITLYKTDEILNKENIESLEEKLNCLKYKAVAIAKVKFTAENPLPKNLEEDFKTIIGDNNIDLSPDKSKESNEYKLVRELDKNLRELMISRAASTIGLITAAIGATLLALSPFTGPFTPAVAMAGIIFVSLGVVIDMGQLLITNIVNNHVKKQSKAELTERYEKNNLLNNNVLEKMTMEEKFKFRCSFELSKDSFGKLPKNDGINDKELENRWYKFLLSMDDKKAQQHLLNVAVTKKFDQHILSELNLDTKHISEKDKQQIINRKCRSKYMANFKHQFDLFFPKNEKPGLKEKKVMPNFNFNLKK